MAELEKIDFGFRYGTEDELNLTNIKDRTLNFTIDTSHFFLDIDGIRLSMFDIITGLTEAQITSVESPERKFYYAKDTYRFLCYDTESLEWKIVNNETAKYTEMDQFGNNIYDYYATKEENEQVAQNLDNLVNEVADIVRFKVAVYQDSSSLPAEGEIGTIYFVKSQSDENDGNNNTDNQYVEYLWITDSNDISYYEEMGLTTVDLYNYYTKDEVDNLLANVYDAIDGLQNQISGIQESLDDGGTVMSKIDGVIDDLATEVTNREQADIDLQNQIDSLQT